MKVIGTTATKEVRSATATVGSVATSSSNATLLAANANRLGASITNDSAVNMYLKMGATASSTSYTKLLIAAEYFAVPFNYTGQIDGILASSTGSARVTEYI